MWLLGDGTFQKVIKVNWGQKGGALIKDDWCPPKKRKIHQLFLYLVGLSPSLWDLTPSQVHSVRVELNSQLVPNRIACCGGNLLHIWLPEVSEIKRSVCEVKETQRETARELGLSLCRRKTAFSLFRDEMVSLSEICQTTVKYKMEGVSKDAL